MTGIDQEPSAAEVISIADLLALIEEHAEASLARGETNKPYVTQVRKQIPSLEALLVGGSEAVNGVVMTWLAEAGPIASQVFNEEVTVENVDGYAEFRPTVFPGIDGRLRVLVRNMAAGHLVSLDLQPSANRLDDQDDPVDTLVPILSP